MDCAVTLPWSALVDFVVNFFTGQSLWKFEENLEALKVSRNGLKATMDRVTWTVKEEKGYELEMLPDVDNWLNTVEDLLSEVDKLVTSIDKEADSSCICFFFSTKIKLADKVYRSLQRVTEEQKKRGDFKELVGKPPPKAGAERNVEPTVGTDAMLDDAWNFILEKESGTLGIYGMGGVGKTTLLKQINNRLLDNPGDFEVIIFVTVSKDSREEKIQDEICSSLGLSSADLKKSGKRVQAIFNALSKMKFVLLLDDLWGPIELADDIGVPKQGKRSKVVLTTRKGDVCTRMEATKLIKVDPLEWDFAWPLFKSKVGEETLSSHADIPALAEGVAKACAGLPIALITIGRAMALKNNPEEWTSAREDLLKRSADSQLKDIENVYHRLKFSYDELPDEAKACFLYCSLFPEDFKILKRSLIDYWRCEEFVSTDKVGYDIIGSLSRACLLEAEKDYVKMHDVIRDMALWIAIGKQYLVLTGDKRLTEVHDVADWKDKTRISLMSNNIEKVTGNPNCPALVTLFLCDNVELADVSGSFFQEMNALKVLDLSNTAITELPVGVSNLKWLLYLNLSNTDIEELPIDLRGLVNLKFLNLEDTVYLGMIPRGLIPSFLWLRVLKMYKCGSLCKEVREDSIWSSGDLFEKELQGLKHLEDLTTTIRDTSILQSSHILFKSFQAIVLEHVTGSKSLNIWSLRNMEKLQNLVCNSHDLEVYADKSNLEESQTQVRAGRGRQKVEISKAPQRFESLRELTVENCDKLVDLTWVVLLPKLAILKVELCAHIKEIINDQKLSELSVEGETFQRLEILVLYGLPELYSIYSKTLPLPNLTTVSIRRCQKLEKLPLNSSRAGECSINADKGFVYEKDETN